ncbi:unnamed protein product [Brachionus calyciflorus]|uniref:Uncharacterized protein n=1 Tax=Brachionus calyciflorus TaxID=104777 RepID=A0A813S556_9BILA|nr:unnamed protein product [Brachionus calyciflorus]
MSDKNQKHKKQKKGHHHRDHQNFDQRNFQNKNQAQTSQQASSQDDIQIPGFYYDPIKNKYFRIQSNSFGIESVHTNESIKNKLDSLEIETKCKLQLKNRNNMINFMFTKEMYGIDTNLRVKYTDNIILNSKLTEKISLYVNNDIKKIEFFADKSLSENTKFSYLLVNCTSYNYSVYKIDKRVFNPNIICTENMHERLDFIEIVENGGISGPFGIKQSNRPAYITNNNYLVSNYKSTNVNDQRPYKLKLCEINSCYSTDNDHFLEEKLKIQKSYKFPLWSSSVNKEFSKCAIGTHQGAECNNLQDNFLFSLNTKQSDAYCVAFRPDVNQVFAGCQNKFVFGYDLRNKVNNPVIEMEHASCLNKILFNSNDSNYLFANDFTGDVKLWDIRNPKFSVAKYSDNIECNLRCSFELDQSINYLYLMAKDGHIRVFNTLTNKLIKTILSPITRQPNQTYVDIPSIQFIDNLSMLYGIRNKLMHFTI